jgi:hypothetical protein
MARRKSIIKEREAAQLTNPDSPLLTAYQSGRVRYWRGMPIPAGASRELVRGWHEAQARSLEAAAPR